MPSAFAGFLYPSVSSCLFRRGLAPFLLFASLMLAPAGTLAQQIDPAAAARPQSADALPEPPQSILSPEMKAATRPFHGVRYKVNVTGANPGRMRNGSVPYQCGSHPNLQYFGGPVITHIQPVAVYWSSDVNSQIVSNMPQFFADLGQSTWMNVVNEYETFGSAFASSTTTNQPIGNGSTNVHGYTIVPSVCPASNNTKTCKVTDAQIQTEIQNQINASNLPAPTYDNAGQSQTLYMVFFPPKVTVAGPDGAGNSCVNGGFCAYHNTGTINSQPLLYGALMDEFTSGCATGCGGDATALENQTDTASHEFAEAITDADIGLDNQANYAYPAGWADNNCGEIADICDSGGAGDSITVSGRSWIVQELWSNVQNQCASTGTAYATSPLTVGTSGSATTGSPYSFTVTALNPNNTTYTGYTGTVSFSSSDPSAALPASYTFTSGDKGQHTFSVTFETAASSQSITATDANYGDLSGTGSVAVAQAQPTVPNVVGDTQSTASSAITGAGLVVGTVTSAPSIVYAAGDISGQNPAGGTQVSSGSSVNLTVSTGPLLSPVPGSVLGGLTTFTWPSGDASYDLTIGTTGAGSSDIYSSGSISATSAEVTIPSNGATLYVRLVCLGTPTLTADYIFTEDSAINVGSTSSTETATLVLTSNATLGSISVVTQGASNLDFQMTSGGTCAVNTSYSVGQNCTVNYTFHPTTSGLRDGAVLLYDTAVPANIIATAYLQEIGTGPQVVFSPSTISTLGGGFNNPWAVAVDASGNIYVADYTNKAVKEMPAGCASSSCVTTLGGGFVNPRGIAVDGSGNVYVADFTVAAVKEIPPGCTSSSCVTTVGSAFNLTGNPEPYGLAVDASGNVFVADQSNNAVYELHANCGGATNCATALGGGFYEPQGVAVDGSGNVYVADTYNNLVKEMPANCASSACVTTLGGGFLGPGGVAVDAAGDVYVADSGNDAIKEMPANCLSSSCVTTLAGGPTVNQFSDPLGIAVGGNGNIFIGDTDNSRVKEVARTTPPAFTFQTTNAGATSTDSPQTVTVQNIGTANLNVSNVTYAADFPEASGVATDCKDTTSLTAGTSCTLSIDFSPLDASLTGSSTALSESVSLTDNNLNGANVKESLAVSGTETASAATLSSPAASSVLTGPTIKFTWTAMSGATAYNFRLGTALGSANLYGSGPITATFVTVSNLPLNGSTLYLQLCTHYDSIQECNNYTFTAPTQAALTSPTPSSVLVGPSVKFSWNAGGGDTGYSFRLGTTQGGNNIYGSGSTTATSATVSNLPTNGETIYARLYTNFGSSSVYNDYVFTAASPAALISPAANSILTGPKVTFTWSVAGGGSSYSFRLGTTQGGNNIYGSGSVTATSATVSNLPTNGEKIYARLYTNYASGGVYADYVFTSASPASLTSPAPNSTLTGSKVTFTWSAGGGSSSYSFRLGTTQGGNNLYGSGPVTGTSVTVSNLPTNGEKIYARLYTNYASGGVYSDYVFTAATQTALIPIAPDTAFAHTNLALNLPTRHATNMAAGLAHVPPLWKFGGKNQAAPLRETASVPEIKRKQWGS